MTTFQQALLALSLCCAASHSAESALSFNLKVKAVPDSQLDKHSKVWKVKDKNEQSVKGFQLFQHLGSGGAAPASLLGDNYLAMTPCPPDTVQHKSKKANIKHTNNTRTFTKNTSTGIAQYHRTSIIVCASCAGKWTYRTTDPLHTKQGCEILNKKLTVSSCKCESIVLLALLE